MGSRCGRSRVSFAITSLIAIALNRRSTLTFDVSALTIEAERVGAAAVREEVYTHAFAVVNTGRSDQTQVIAGSRYPLILDGNSCAHDVRAYDDVLRHSPTPSGLRKSPSPDCEGGTAIAAPRPSSSRPGRARRLVVR